MRTANSSVLILVLSMHTVNMFSMLVDLDMAYKWMAEQYENSNETLSHTEEPDNVSNDVLEDHEVIAKSHQQFGEHEEENTPQPYLMGWDWINLREKK